MAYNTSKGDRELGDIKNEADPDTQIDFGSDTLTFKTNDAGRLFVTNTHVSCSVNLSASAFYGDGSWLQGVTGSGGTGDASGPGSSTDNAIARYDGAGGKTLQNSSVTIDDAGNITAGSAQISVNSAVVGGGGVSSTGTISGSGELTVKNNIVSQASVNVSGNANIAGFLTASQGISLTSDSQRLSVGSTGQFYVVHASNTILANQVGHLTFDVETSGKNLRFQLGDDTGASKVQFRNNSGNSVTSVDSAGILATNAYGLNGIASGSISLNDIIVPVGYSSTVVKFAKASPKTLSGSRGPFYVSYTAAGDGASVTALKSRLITGIDTSAAQNVGDALYLNPVSSGSYVIGVPNPTADDAHFSLIVRVGRVLNVHASTGAVILEPPGAGAPLVGQVIAGGGSSTFVTGFGAAFSGSQGSCAVQATANTDPSPGDDDQIKTAFIRADGKLQISLDDSSGTPLLTYTIYG
tara:strand:+ start:251 stop:1651 length:1401 start_codon:yes stop_codon:yes gene_type:complete